MAKDFIRIGGEIVSQPLNENFRRLLNAISIANVNLVFPEENGVVNTISDMHAIAHPVDAQACYVISSGEIYRYTNKGNGQWIKIADFGNTFRQGFLNSGLVQAEGPFVRLNDTQIKVPAMLVYFKNKEGDNTYLKGMYKVDETIYTATNELSTPGAYSIYVRINGGAPEVFSLAGMPAQDDVNKIYLGSFVIDNTNKILDGFVFSIPDMAFTEDRGLFYLNGGQANGCNLVTAGTHDNKVNRQEGHYYDEGINYPIGNITEYPATTDNGSNYNLKYYSSVTPVTQLYYMTPENGLNNDIIVSDGLIYNKYYDTTTGTLKSVEPNHFTIQQHLVTPNGHDVILYGTKVYNSLDDAESNINSVFGADVNFPYVEATRIIIGNYTNLDSGNTSCCKMYVLGRLAQVGTISPIFADDKFTIYSGTSMDTTPAAIRFNLDELEDEDYDIDTLGKYNLRVLPYNTTRRVFSLAQKYITDNSILPMTTTINDTRTGGNPGYELADVQDLEYAITRINDIEAELWATYDSTKQRYEQGVRKRLYDVEGRLDTAETDIDNLETRATSLEQNKVNKTTLVNGYTLGDTTLPGEAKSIQIKTGDIAEGAGLGQGANLWYTDARVNANTNVAAATQHINTVSANDDATTHTVVNPHRISTDDINILANTNKLFVDSNEERRIRSDRLPDNTIQALADLDAKNLDSVPVTLLGGSSESPTGTRTFIGNAKALEIFEYGAGVNMKADGETLQLECKGQVDYNTVMTKTRYATIEAQYPEIYGGYVDKAVNAQYADNVHGIELATANQYYGTDSLGEVGIYDLPTYVTTVDQSSFASIDQIVIVPVDGSVTENSLHPDLRAKINNNYHAIYDDGTLVSAEVNAFNFGDNLAVSVNNGRVTINATGTGGQAVHEFVNLDDVNVSYTGNAGKMLVVNSTADGIALTSTPSMNEYMLKAAYVDSNQPLKVKHAKLADNATNADTADNAVAVNNKSVDDSETSADYLWTANQIITYVGSQISAQGVNTYSGTSVPSSSLGKNGDIYVLIEA